MNNFLKGTLIKIVNMSDGDNYAHFVKCPFNSCGNQELAKDYMGLCAHIRKHKRKGEIPFNKSNMECLKEYFGGIFLQYH